MKKLLAFPLLYYAFHFTSEDIWVINRPKENTYQKTVIMDSEALQGESQCPKIMICHYCSAKGHRASQCWGALDGDTLVYYMYEVF